MSTIHFRPDYAKFLFDTPPDLWHHYYSTLNAAAHERQYAGDWLKHHKVNRLWYNADVDRETWSIDIWGEWAGIVEVLPEAWFQSLRRFDVRAVVWDATGETVLDLGQHLQRNVTSHNVNVYNTKRASKRLGRDRGGIGVAIGSHKSDLRLALYKRTGEPVAMEFQMSGNYLTRLIGDIARDYQGTKSTRSLWTALVARVRAAGDKRMARVLESAGVGTYWPVVRPDDIPDLPPIQATLIAEFPEDELYP